jgi:hypothetical protein
MARVTSFTVSARRTVNVAKYESFELGLSLVVEPDAEKKVNEQVEFYQRAVRSRIDAEVDRLLTELHLPGGADGQAS